MLITCLALCTMSLRVGDVVTIPPSAAPVAAGLLNWALREAVLAVPPRTRAIVVRIGPDGLMGAVEVRLFDGTDRLAWLDGDGLAPLTPPRPESSTATTGPGASRSPASRSPCPALAIGQRRRRRPDFTQVDAAIAMMFQATLAAEAATPRGMGVYRMPVFSMPVYQMSVFNMPIFGMPVFGMPVFSMPVF